MDSYLLAHPIVNLGLVLVGKIRFSLQ